MPFQTGGGNIAKLAYDESQEAKQSASTAITSANEANAKSDFTQKQLDQVAGASTIDPAVEQMKVDTEGTTHASPDARLRSDYNKVTSQLAETATGVDGRKEIENVQVEPLRINTFDGTNQPFHPSVYYNPSGWNGKKFWMAYTPLPVGIPPYQDRWECPCIVSSDDGVNWETPYGAPDPLIDLTPEEIANKDYFSDTCIVMNGTTMEVWFRKTNGANTSQTDIYRITTTNGVAWSSPEKVLDSLQENNGFGNLQTMRSQQLFFDGAKYIAFFSMQGGSGYWRAETQDPSSGIWSNLTKLTFKNSPAGMNIWHLGMMKDGSTYHMTAYDVWNNAIQHFTSDDGIAFDFKDSILKSDSNSKTGISIFNTLYQSVAVKININEWLLYAGGTFNDTKRGIVLYRGKRLNNLIPVNGGLIKNRMYYDNTPVLLNKFGDNSAAQKYFATHFDVKGNKFNGYKMAFGNTYNVPIWYDRFKNIPILHIVDGTSTPSSTPEHEGMIWRNINTGEIWMSLLANGTLKWNRIKTGDTVVNQQRKNVTATPSIDVTGVYRLVIQSSDPTTITNLTGLVDGQELWILNTDADPMTLQNNATGSGNMRLKGGQNVVLNQWDSISLIAVNSTWYQK